jgi:hypothetical protein
MLFICSKCDTEHLCGRDECNSLFYNSDHTNVCTITGMCFDQRMCELFIDPVHAFTNDDPVYFKRTKRDQQIKNKVLDRVHTMKIIACVAKIIELTVAQNEQLCARIMELWSQFVLHISSKKHYVHRKDKRCFVVAIAMSLENGIKNNMGYFVVSPHKLVKREKLNKKSKYDEFDVSDIRYGQNLIKKVFKGVVIDTKVTVCIP